MEQDGDVVLLELRSEELITSRRWVIDLDTAADQIRTVLLNSLVIDSECSNKDGHLEQEVNDDAEASDEAEVLESWHVGEETDEESKTLTKCCSEN